MWPTILAEIAARILAARTYFSAVAPSLPVGSGVAPSSSPAEATAKGLIFVQLYAIYEYAVTHAVRAAWLEINGRATPIANIRLELLGAILHDDLTAAMQCGEKRVWEMRMSLFRRVNSADPIFVPDERFPADGSHFRVKQLQTIWELFGIPGHPLPQMPLIGLIDNELVEHRNAVAHGRITAENVGRTYSTADIMRKIDDTLAVCLHLVTTLQAHCSNPILLQR